MLVFWEVTRSCQLACQHCRASATPAALPGELDHEEGRALIDQVAGFGRPFPILIFTGGDCLLRPDVFELVDYAAGLGIPVAMSPSVTPMLTPSAIASMVERGVKAVSLSLDGATATTHDGIRGIPGHFGDTIPAIRALVEAGLTVQINTTVMRANVDELASVAQIVAETGAHIWEVFFLVHVGRGEATGAISADEHEQVCHLLYDASHYGFIVRTVEAPFFRRVVVQRREGGPAPAGDLYAASARRPRGSARSARAAILRAHRGDPRRQGHRVRRPRRPGLPGGVLAAGARLGARHPAVGAVPRQRGAASDPLGRVRRSLRTLRVGRPVRRVTRAGLRDQRRPAGRGPRLHPPARPDSAPRGERRRSKPADAAVPAKRSCPTPRQSSAGRVVARGSRQARGESPRGRSGPAQPTVLGC
jgi:MoaA/NifB/PqqE/SkfB family radical SAM enzyme